MAAVAIRIIEDIDRGDGVTRIVRAAVVLWTDDGIAMSFPVVPANGRDTIEGQIDMETEAEKMDTPTRWQRHTPGEQRIRLELAGGLGIATRDLAAALRDVRIRPAWEIPRRDKTGFYVRSEVRRSVEKSISRRVGLKVLNLVKESTEYLVAPPVDEMERIFEDIDGTTGRRAQWHR